jgi:hypothetical protein
MYLEKSLEKKWLVKSENKILGPYNFDQIVDLIRKKQIVLIDEIRDPETRWLYIRENNAFKTIVEEIRKEIDSKQESTKTYQSISKTFDDPMFKTKTDINHFTDINLEAKEISVISEEHTIQQKTALEKKVEKAKVYGVDTDKAVKIKLNIFSSKVILATVAVLVLIASSVGSYVYIQKRNLIKQEEDLVLQVKKYKFLGLYQRAVDLFSKLPTANQKKLIPDLLDIFPLLETSGQASIEDIKSLTGLSTEQKSNVELINFWRSMQQQNYPEAQEFLVKATTLQPRSLLIRENEALLYLKKGQFLNSFNSFKDIFNKEKSGRYLLGMLQSYFGLSSIDRTRLGKDLLASLDKYTSTYFDYKKELLLGQISLALETNNELLYRVSLKQYFNTPCQLSAQFTKPILLAPNSYLWKDLNDVKTLVQKPLFGDDVILFQLHDLLEQGQLSAATEHLSNNISRVASLQNREQMNLLLYNSQNRNSEVITLEKANHLDMTSELNHLLLAMNKIELDENANITNHLEFLTSKQQAFYKDWLVLEQLIKKNAKNELKSFIKDHFITTQDFGPVFVARSLIN